MQSHLVNRCVAVSVVLLLCFSPSAIHAQGELLTQAPKEYRAFGAITDEAEQPISNATVSLLTLPTEPRNLAGLLYQDPRVTSDQSNEDGEFDIRVPGTDPCWNRVNDRTTHLLIVEAAGFETSVTKFTRDRLLVELPFGVSVSSCQSLQMKVIDKEGVNVDDVQLCAGQINGNRLPYKFGLAKQEGVKENGLFEIVGVSRKSLSGVYLSSETRGNFFLPLQSTEGGHFIQLPETGTVNAGFEIPESVAPTELAGKRIVITGGNAYAMDVAPDTTLSWETLTLDDDASATSSNISFGAVTFRFIDPESVSLCDSLKDLTISSTLSKENSPLEVTRKLYKSKVVELRFENDSGEIIPTVHTSAIGGSQGRQNEGGIIGLRIPVADKPSGQMFPFDSTGEYQVTSAFGVMLDRIEMKDGKYEPITMTRSRSLKGRVMDEQGQVVVGAKVEYTIPSERFTLTKSVLTNVSGDFRIDGLPTNVTVALKASKGNQSTPEDAKISVTSGDAEEVLIPVVAQPVAEIAGMIIDQKGMPVPNAEVKLYMANVYQKEGFSGEQVGAVDLIPDFSGVSTDANGSFRYPSTTKFGKRIQVSVSAPGFRSKRFPFINGSLKTLNEQTMQLGSLPLFKLPARLKTTATVVDQSSGKPIQNATLVFIGIDSTKQIASTDEHGKVTVDAEDTQQLVAVNADGYELKLNVLESIPETIEVSLAPTGDETSHVAWLEKDWLDFHQQGRKLLKQLEVPKPKESTFFRQNMFLKSQINSDFDAFQANIDASEYEHEFSLLSINATDIFLNAPQQSLKLLMSSEAESMQKAILLAQSALLSDDDDFKEELYGEAIVQAGQCSGNKGLMTYGQIASSLVMDGRVDVAKELMSEAWNSADELKEQLKNKESKTKIAESRAFAPFLGLIDANTGIALIRLTGIETEVPGLIEQCLAFASIEGSQDLDAICKKQNVSFNATGLGDQFRTIEMSHARYDTLANWIQEHVATMPDSSSKVDAIMLAARHLQEGPQRRKLLFMAVKARESCNPFYHYDDPTKEILEELPKFDSLTTSEFDELLFATLQHAPAKTESMQTNMVYANLIKMVAIKDAEAARKMLDPAFGNGAWLYGEPNWPACNDSTLLKVYAWIDPELAVQKAIQLSDEYSNDDPVRKLQLLTTVIAELNRIAIRKGMLRARK